METNDPLITIGITCYREGAWLRECWESVCSQTDKRWEAVMVLDGGADDTTRNIFEAIEHPSLRKFAMQKNVGPYLCRSLAILNAKTDWYAHLDGDDMLPEKAISQTLETIRKNPTAEFVFGDCMHFGQGTEEIRQIKEFNIPQLVYGASITGQSPIKKDLFWQLGGFAPDLLDGGADWDFWIGVAERNFVGHRVDGLIYKRRRREGSVGRGWRYQRDHVAEIIIQRHPDFFSIEDRKALCLGKANEMIARDYRSAGKRKLAAEYARKAIDYGFSTGVLREILREEKMVFIRFLLRRIARFI